MDTASVCVATGNIGYGKNASQTGVVANLTADLALDGVGYWTGIGIHHCPYAFAPSGSTAYWTVDLGKRHQILNITIYKLPGTFILNVILMILCITWFTKVHCKLCMHFIQSLHYLQQIEQTS